MAARQYEITDNAVWYWNASSDPFSKTATPIWTTYSDTENEIIENVYKQKHHHATLENYRIDFKRMLQINKNDKNKQRPIKRVMVNTEQQCFIPQIPPTESNTFNEGGEICRLVWEWAKQENNGSHILKQNEVRRILEQAVTGIQYEGKMLGKEEEGIMLCKLLLEKRNSDLDTLYRKCILIYTMESFLYRLTNKTLRTNDMSKLKTLGPFAFLLNNALWRYRSNGPFTLYRGMKLEPKMIEMYQNSIEKVRSWPAFTSTTKNPQVVKHFLHVSDSSMCPVLFIIDVIPRPFVPSLCTDITLFSYFSNEEEVLLPTAVSFLVRSVTKMEDGSYEIRLTI